MTPIVSGYFGWLCSWVYDINYGEYNKLLESLFYKDFYAVIVYDQNRAVDGLALRKRYCDEFDVDIELLYSNLSNECSILELMVALSIRCETSIVADPNEGDRTAQWFWSMITSLGLLGMNDRNFKSEEVDEILTKFIERDYDYDGHGSLFTIPNSPYDIRMLEIWDAMGWYLDDLLHEGYI